LDLGDLFPDGHLFGTFAHAPLAAVEECLVRWGNEEKMNRGTVARRHTMTLRRAWDLVAARGPNPDRAFLIDVSEWRVDRVFRGDGDHRPDFRVVKGDAEVTARPRVAWRGKILLDFCARVWYKFR